MVIVGSNAIRAFRQSKQAVTESASLISVIVDALAPRIQRSESVVKQLRSDVEAVMGRSDALAGEQVSLRTSHKETLHHFQEILSNEKELLLDFEHVKSKLNALQQRILDTDALPKRENLAAVSDGDFLASLNPTERLTLEILRDEGAKTAPEIGKRLQKSREHASRLMKKLYMEGYVDRESNRAPFRYRLNEALRLTFESSSSTIRAKPSETF
ncbi:MAG: MarR family transcriptional regulator [Candidatus Bathyarchaeia archaeon]